MKYLTIALTLLGLTACATYHVPDSVTLYSNKTWVIMPMQNHSNTVLAAEKVERILRAQLYKKGVNAELYPAMENNDLASILDTSIKQNHAKDWLLQQNADYIITGSIEEWHYKSGLDGEPAVGISLEIISADKQTVYWRATGSRSGWGRESVSRTGHIVLETLLDGIDIEQLPEPTSSSDPE